MGWFTECIILGVKGFVISFFFLLCWALIAGIGALTGTFMEDKDAKK